MPVHPDKSTSTRRVVLEVCVDSVADAAAAAAGGADRLELNAALALDGLTPSLGLLAEVRRTVGTRVPVVAMARPRAGDFRYDDGDFRVLCRDVGLLLEHGADGIAFGVLTADGCVDVPRCRRVVRQIESVRVGRGKSPAAAVFHRAFDQVRDPERALAELIDLGVRRLMTSGRQPTALRGATLVARLVENARGRIEILPAGGVRPSNAAAILSRTGCDQLHTSLRRGGVMDRQFLSDMVDVLNEEGRRGT
jgi:copper homeostasis protein